jgi:hypothetical protein
VKAKLPIIAGLILLLLIGVLLVLILRFPQIMLNPAKLLKPFGVAYPWCKRFPSDTFRGTVTAWDPRGPLLEADLDSGCRVRFVADTPKTRLIIPVNEPGTSLNERMLLSRINGSGFEKAFCLGDRILAEAEDLVDTKLTDNQPARVKVIRNLGPRTCAFSKK